MELRDRVGIVVGAGSILGEVVASGLAREEMTLELVDRVGQGLPGFAAELQNAADAPVVAREIDLGSAEQIGESMDRALREYGRIDLLVDAVELPRTPRITRGTPDDWPLVVEGTLQSVYAVCCEGVRRMAPRQQGQVILLCPCAGSPDAYEGALSVAVREGILGLCREMRRELKQDGIRVDCICHGPVDPPPAGNSKEVVERLVRPEEVGRAVLWLATSEPDVRVGDLVITAR
jgi:NAD(P)-dependent dehydrogenase (short-subunit alcohol dehydrogenase family)